MSQYYISFPVVFSETETINFLSRFEFIFFNQQQPVSNVVIDFSLTEEMPVLHILLIVKVIEYAINNNCVTGVRYVGNDLVNKAFMKFGFALIGNHHMQNINDYDPTYANFKVKQEDGFLIAPQGLLRSITFSKETLQQRFLPSIEDYYKDNHAAMFLILTCLSEVALNFLAHATEDAKSTLVAYGNKQQIEITCVDTGQGIISTLGPTLEEAYTELSDVLRKAMGREVTSKKRTNHMGFGLWLITEIALATNATLRVYSEGAFYYIEKGEISSGSCPYWQGTVFYLLLPLQTGLALEDIIKQTETTDGIEPAINWQ